MKLVKELAILLLMIFLAACNSSDNAEEFVENVSNNNELSPLPITLVASRDYNPSSWSHYESAMTTTTTVSIPTKILITAGNSGTG